MKIKVILEGTWTEWQSDEGRWKLQAWPSQVQDIAFVHLQKEWSYNYSNLSPVEPQIH